MTKREAINVLKKFGLQAISKTDDMYQTNKWKLACLNAISILKKQIPIPLENWHEDHGICLWWHFPIEEPPYCGTPLDMGWEYANRDNYYTHFTRIIVPELEEN